MITRAEYMADSKALHQAYYLEIAQAAGLCLPKDLIERARASTDPHYNDIPLQVWDAAWSGYERSLRRECKARGDHFAPVSGVCAAKALARHLVGRG